MIDYNFINKWHGLPSLHSLNSTTTLSVNYWGLSVVFLPIFTALGNVLVILSVTQAGVGRQPNLTWKRSKFNISVLSDLGRTGPQEKINPQKSCRTNGHVCALLTGLGNMPKANLTLNEFVPSVPFWKN